MADLPRDLIQEISSYLSLEDLISVAKTCKHWRLTIYKLLFVELNFSGGKFYDRQITDNLISHISYPVTKSLDLSWCRKLTGLYIKF